MPHFNDEVYKHIPVNKKIYDILFAKYLRLGDPFFRSKNNVIKTLKIINIEVSHAA